ncbi:N-acetylmuramoyl-L-alanine amidase [Candidatus Erwinia haradaeae]|nr:N-acetylmuramoyl-L-alanine amidase [Candidatus Erwinia haradaeae]
MLFFFLCSSNAANLLDIDVSNSRKLAKIKLVFSAKPVYFIFHLRQPDRIVLDISHSAILCGLPHRFQGKKIVTHIRASINQKTHNTRLVFKVSNGCKMKVMNRYIGARYHVLFTIFLPEVSLKKPFYTKPLGTQAIRQSRTALSKRKHTQEYIRKMIHVDQTLNLHCKSSKIIVAIDAGHGGQDPGAIGRGGLQEKNVTMAIAHKLKQYLDSDPMFTGVMIRHGDNFISVKERSAIAYKKKANILISIHVDSAPNHQASGASAWVLSNRRVDHEMAHYLEVYEKTRECLVKTKKGLQGHTQNDPYLHQVLLDLQFDHSQKVGYSIATTVLAQLQRISPLHKNKPAYASFGVLRSPCVPSLLIEIGFISNPREERLLGSYIYRNKITQSIYHGLHTYFLLHPPSCNRQEQRQRP